MMFPPVVRPSSSYLVPVVLSTLQIPAGLPRSRKRLVSSGTGPAVSSYMLSVTFASTGGGDDTHGCDKGAVISPLRTHPLSKAAGTPPVPAFYPARKSGLSHLPVPGWASRVPSRYMICPRRITVSGFPETVTPSRKWQISLAWVSILEASRGYSP